MLKKTTLFNIERTITLQLANHLSSTKLIQNNKQMREEIILPILTSIKYLKGTVSSKAVIGNFQFTVTGQDDSSNQCAIDVVVHDKSKSSSSPSITSINKLRKFYSPKTVSSNYLFLLIIEYNSKDSTNDIIIQVKLIEDIDVTLFSGENLGRGQVHLSTLKLAPYLGTRNEWMKGLYLDILENYATVTMNIETDIKTYTKEIELW